MTKFRRVPLQARRCVQGATQATSPAFAREVLETLHAFPELFVQHPDGTWSLREGYRDHVAQVRKQIEKAKPCRI